MFVAIGVSLADVIEVNGTVIVWVSEVADLVYPKIDSDEV